MKKVVIDPSISVECEIKPVSMRDRTPLYFRIKGTQTWTGQFELKLWNSDIKNEEFTITGANPLTAQGQLLSWNIHPTTQGLAVKKYYFEIFSTEFERIIFKGTLPIVK
jgi:hypothetical protein